jgi:hypothetical protein
LARFQPFYLETNGKFLIIFDRKRSFLKSKSCKICWLSAVRWANNV